MDIYSFINSRDIAEYCRETRHKFNALETAFFVHENKFMSVEEKHNVYREIMETMPDVEFGKRKSKEYGDKSFFNVLKRYITAEEILLDIMKRHDAGMVYTYEIWRIQDRDSYESKVIYSTFEKAEKAVMEQIEIELEHRVSEYETFPPDDFKSQIMKKRLDTEYTIYADYSKDGKITNIEFYNFDESDSKLAEAAETRYLFDMWIYVPVPFKKGDILCEVFDRDWHSSEVSYDVIVFEETCYDKMTNERILKLYDGGCTMDMYASAYWMRKDGSVYWDWFHGLHNLEYYRGELKGKARIMKTMSAVAKGETTPDLILYAINRIHSDEISDRLDKDSNNDFITEALEEVGLLPEGKK